MNSVPALTNKWQALTTLTKRADKLTIYTVMKKNDKVKQKEASSSRKVKTSTYEIGTSAFQQIGFTDKTLTKLIHRSPEASPCQMFQIQSVHFPSTYDDCLPSSPGCLQIP